MMRMTAMTVNVGDEICTGQEHQCLVYVNVVAV